MILAEFRQSGFTDHLAARTTWEDALKRIDEDGFFVELTRMTLI